MDTPQPDAPNSPIQLNLDAFMELYPWAYTQIREVLWGAVLEGVHLQDAWPIVNSALAQKGLVMSFPKYSTERMKWTWALQGISDTGQTFTMPMEMI